MSDSVNRWSPDQVASLVERYERPLLAYASRMLGGDFAGAQDAVQETFLRLCRESPAKLDGRIAAWLFSVCRTRVIDMQRSHHQRPVDAAELAVADPAPDAAQAAVTHEDQQRLTRLVGELSPRQQEVLRLRMQAGLSYREIAEITGLTVSNVGFHLHAAVKNLRDSLAVH